MWGLPEKSTESYQNSTPLRFINYSGGRKKNLHWGKIVDLEPSDLRLATRMLGCKSRSETAIF